MEEEEGEEEVTETTEAIVEEEEEEGTRWEIVDRREAVEEVDTVEIQSRRTAAIEEEIDHPTDHRTDLRTALPLPAHSTALLPLPRARTVVDPAPSTSRLVPPRRSDTERRQKCTVRLMRIHGSLDRRGVIAAREVESEAEIEDEGVIS